MLNTLWYENTIQIPYFQHNIINGLRHDHFCIIGPYGLDIYPGMIRDRAGIYISRRLCIFRWTVYLVIDQQVNDFRK